MNPNQKLNRVVLAYSGGLDTSAMLLWLKETYACEVVCYTDDVGQEEELDGLEDTAKATGAVSAFVEDITDEYPNGRGRVVHAERGISFDIVNGETLGLVG